MPVNPYFSAGRSIGNRPEQNLVQQLTDEIIRNFGIDLIYIPRTEVKIDIIFGEDVLSKFTKHFVIEMYMETVQQYGGPGDVLGRDGLTIPDTTDLIVSRYRFPLVTQMNQPREGDLIYFPTGRALFEIKYVEDEIPFYPLGKQTVFRLSCELFHYSQEEISTGFSEIDQLADALENNNNPENDRAAFNEEIEEEAEEVIFDESRPFGKW